MRRRFTLAGLLAGIAIAVSCLAPSLSWAEEKEGGPEATASEWFKNLKRPGSGEPCCDESDCARAESQWRNGAWWARSNRTGQWFRVPSDVVTPETSIFPSAILCECNPSELRPDGTWEPCIFCFVPLSPGS